MRPFRKCSERRDGRCTHTGNACIPNTTIAVERCWRMVEEHEEFLQCPTSTCEANLWFDQLKNRGTKKMSLYCPKCERSVARRKAIQTPERLGSEIWSRRDTIREIKEACPGIPNQTQWDRLQRLQHEELRLIEMLVNLAILESKK